MVNDDASNSAAPDSSSGSEGKPELDAADQAAMDEARSVDPNSPVAETDWAQIERIQERANDKARLAESMSANTVMRVDPAVVDDLATFYEEEALALEQRRFDLYQLGAVPAPGSDPTSVNAASAHSRVGDGDDQSYLPNYDKLTQVFRDTAASLRASAKQTRTDDDGAADQFRGGDFA